MKEVTLKQLEKLSWDKVSLEEGVEIFLEQQWEKRVKLRMEIEINKRECEGLISIIYNK